MSAATATMSFDVSAALMSSVTKSYQEFGLQLVQSLSQKYGFSIDEAMVAIGLDGLTVSKKVSKKASKGEPKSKKEKAPKKVKPSVPLPFVGVIAPNDCFGINFNKGLHTQCTNSPLETGEYCSKCQKQADGNASGKPNMGDIRDRMECDLLEFRDPKGRQTLPYANVVQKAQLDMDKCLEEAAKFGVQIPECHLEVRETKRGRPKKSVDGSEASSQASSENKPKKTRGRPKKVKTVESVVGDDLLAALAASQANAEIVQETAQETSDAESVSTTDTKKSKRSRLSAEEKAERLAMKEAEKESKRLEREAKKAEKLAEKEAAKAAKLAEREAKKAAKEAEKEAKKAAKEAEREAKKAAKAAEKEAKKATKAPEPVAKPVAEPEMNEDELQIEETDDVNETAESYSPEAVEEEQPQKVKVGRITIEGVEYYKTAENILYDIQTQHPIGEWDPIAKEIVDIDVVSDEEDDEEDDE
jgi:chemotaxis protein histidine kinase CheA